MIIETPCTGKCFRRSKSIGQGVFTFYSEDAKNIHLNIHSSIKLNSDKKKQTGTRAKLNPLSFLFKNGDGGGKNVSPAKTEKQDRGRRKVLEKSKSMMDRFEPIETGDFVDTHIPCDMRRVEESPSPPPFPSPPDDQPISNLLQEGHYYRFDKEQKYDPIQVDEEKVDDALVKLQNIERSLLQLSQQTNLQPQDIRSSYISVDSGRSSDTYAETSASSVASSSTNHSNRLNSNASNCSADSGTDLMGLQDKDPGRRQSMEQDPCIRPAPVGAAVQQDIYGCMKRVYVKEKPTPEPLYARCVGPRERMERRQDLSSSPFRPPPPPVPTRFATIREFSFHNNLESFQR